MAKHEKLCEGADVLWDKVFPHNFRHLFARLYYEQEKNLVRLADILGHSNINTTRIYTMESGRNHMRQLEKLEVLFDFLQQIFSFVVKTFIQPQLFYYIFRKKSTEILNKYCNIMF